MDTELLISEVAKRPALWDISFEEYKNKHIKKDAWIEVCFVVFGNFELQSEAEKKVSVSNVKTKWRAIRDNYIRYLRKEADLRRSGSEKNLTKYIYHEQLSFLQKATANCVLNDGSESDDFHLASEDNKQASKKSGSINKRTHSTTGMRKKLITFTETQEQPILVTAPEVKEDDDLLFFKSLLPTVKALRQDQKMAFRINVMQLLQEFSSTQGTMCNS